MSTVELPNDQWSKVLEFLQSCPDLYVGQETDCRQFIEAVLWMSRSGAQWRLLPECYGNWNSIYKRSHAGATKESGKGCINNSFRTQTWRT